MKPESTGYQFDDVVVRPLDFLVLRGGEPVSLEPKSFKVLVYLIENRGRVVSKDELIQAVWAGTAVTDNALTRVIAQLRRELGDDAKQPRYIETVPTVGYRFLGEIIEVDALRGRSQPPPTRISRTLILGLALTALVIVAISLGSDDRAPIRLQSVSQFTASAGLDQHPTFSPDGASIAYSSDQSGRFEIYVRPIASGAREIQITSDGNQNLEPEWSPDGRSIAYYSQVRNGIFVVPAVGGVSRRLTDFGSQPVWSPDGTMIGFRSAAMATVVPIDLAPSAESTIWIVAAAGGEPRPLTKQGPPPLRHNFPKWSPDGKSIAFVSHGGSGTELWSAPVSGGELKRIRTGASGILYPVYSADGQSLYFVAETPGGGGFSIWRSPIEGTDAVEILPAGLALPRDLAIDAVGRRLSFSLQTMTSSIFSLDLEDGASKPLVYDQSFRNTLPTFSPDGEQIAYLVQRVGMPGSIWLIDPEGKNTSRLSKNDITEWLAGWLPDGQSVAYGTRQDGRNLLWATSLIDGSNRLLGELGLPRAFMRLSPDGKDLVYHAHSEGRTNIWKMDIVTKKATQLTFGEEPMNFPIWSPDGEWIAFESWRGDNTVLSMIDRAGNRQTQLTREAGHAWPYSWSPDSDRIAFAGMREGAWNIWWISRSTGEQRKLTALTSLRSFVRYPAWSPKNDRIVYEFAEAKGNVYVAQLPSK